jgi:uncharacterized protein
MARLSLRLAALFIFATTAALAPSAAGAASFDCMKAAAPDEIAICADAGVSNLDTVMATLYGVRMEIPMLMGARGAAQDEQQEFLTRRAACGSDTTCLQNAYNARIATLQQTISEAMKDYCVKLGIC